MGLAFDISILHASPRTAREISDVLERMAADGDLLFVAERRQLVFHVLPTPERRAYYAALSEAMTMVALPGMGAPAPAVTAFREVSGHAIPLPSVPGEDVLLAGAGVLPGTGGLRWWPLALLALAAVVAGKAILFEIGR
jgi:hypothetical protein